MKKVFVLLITVVSLLSSISFDVNFFTVFPVSLLVGMAIFGGMIVIYNTIDSPKAFLLILIVVFGLLASWLTSSTHPSEEHQLCISVTAMVSYLSVLICWFADYSSQSVMTGKKLSKA